MLFSNKISPKLELICRQKYILPTERGGQMRLESNTELTIQGFKNVKCQMMSYKFKVFV